MKLLLMLLTAGKFGKVLLTGGTMLLSVFVYAITFGWRYAVGFVGLIFVHEMGHFVAARKCGLAVGAPVFIPFVGAWIQLKEQPMDVETEAYVASAGPLRPGDWPIREQCERIFATKAELTNQV